MIFLLLFIFNFELKAPTTEFVSRNGKRIVLFPQGIELYEKELMIKANYAEYDPGEKIFFLKDSVMIFRDKDTCYTDLAIYNLKTKIWEMAHQFFLVNHLSDKGRIVVKGEKAQYDLEKEILSLEKGEVKLKNQVKLSGKKMEIDNRNKFLYSYLDTRIMNYNEREELMNSLSCDTLFYNFKEDTGFVKGKVIYLDSLGEVKGEYASFVLQEETIKEATFWERVFLTFQKENNKIELECKRVKFDFAKNDLRIAYGEEIILGKAYFRKK